ncbi:MAG TPA: response regulator [Bacteroidales bacterium]|nr:response regulator [Bacteroidales bacterium]
MSERNRSSDNITDILVVEDSATQAARIKFLLESYNYKVEISENGQKALEWLSKHTPSLVISDIVMPEMNGFELCNKIKSDERTENTPVILLTSLSDPEEVIEGLSCGADSFITKPFNKDYLISNIEKLITEKANPDSKIDNVGIEINYNGKKRLIRTGQQRAVKLLLSIYEGAIHQNNELIQTRDELKLLNERLEDLVGEKTKDLEIIEFKNNQIKSSIDYACTIQAALMKASENISDFFPGSFCITLPRDIVSGDFYWCVKINDKTLIGVFDCTGHGIPGAFMSILGVTLLKEIVIREGIEDPALVFNHMRRKVVESLGQKGLISEVNVGMNGSLISYDPMQNNLVYAGAYNTIYLIRDDQLIELRGDKMPLSHHLIMKDFSSHEVKIRKNDCVYLFTDGYMDQFGGQMLKKFGYRRFRDLLLKIHKRPFESQKEALINEFRIWRKYEDQVDDITIVGLKL